MSALHTAKPTEPQTKTLEAENAASRWSLVTPVLMMAGSLLASERALAQKPSQSGSSTSGASTLVDSAKEAAAEAQWKAWSRRFAERIPTVQIASSSLVRQIDDLKFRVTEQATLEMPMRFLVTYSSGDETKIHKERLDVLAQHSSVPRDELIKKVHESVAADKRISELERELNRVDFDISVLSPSRRTIESLTKSNGMQEEELTKLAADKAKLDGVVAELREMSGLLSLKASGKPFSADGEKRLKHLSRRLSITSSADAQEALEGLAVRVAGIETAMSRHREEIRAAEAEIKRLAPLAEGEECESFERARNLQEHQAHVAKTLEEARRTIGHLPGLTVDAFVEPQKRESFRQALAALEARFMWREATVDNALGNPAASILLSNDRFGGGLLRIAANEEGHTISAARSERGFHVSIDDRALLRQREVDTSATIKNFVSGTDEVVFREQKPEREFMTEGKFSVDSFELHLCPGSRFDISGLKDWAGSIEPHGSGTIQLGARAGDEGEYDRRPTVRISGDLLEKPLTISIPAGALLKPEMIRDEESFLLVRGLQAELQIAKKGLLSETGTSISFEVRGKDGNVSIPFITDAKLAHPSINELIEKIRSVR